MSLNEGLRLNVGKEELMEAELGLERQLLQPLGTCSWENTQSQTFAVSVCQVASG